MKILVTGASGFLGGHLVEEMVSKGFNVIGMVRKSSDTSLLRSLGVELRVGDLTDPESLSRATENIDIVIHLAAYYTFFGKKEMYRRINVEGTRLLVEAALRNDVKRFVYCSSTEAIGPVKSPPAEEDSLPNPSYEYGRSKLEAEKIVRSYGEKGVEYTILRPSGIYGPRNVDDISYWFITAFARNALPTRIIVGDGRNLVQFVHVKDVVQGFLLVLDKPGISRNQTYFISEDKAYTYLKVYEILSELCNRAPPRIHVPPVLAKAFVAPVEFLNRLRGRTVFTWKTSTVNDLTCDRAYSIMKAVRELGFKPKYDLRTGLRETLEWYRENGYI
ncbi:MAG: NAD-dependent epimerase/dehydratase family protein [Candidatus Brockarchaeota archaeon]|nr:NAD-dependent epimerase/dehydratase family protein [Candidatus Brockarchaeota archaeon]MBO3809040.1 NAD-dependent epimerase/dehydratase family protein [Candidatus Brockarchaeota archaeon]MBO3809724.1 NAD-dependent epimerase/dehydratase family protein [Candidatus Brockarchaeota archaeon]